MTDLPPFDDTELFDEAGYLRLYPGIAEAIAQRGIGSAWGHYCAHGRDEGRQPNDVDPNFYLAAYPEIERDLGRSPTAEDAAPHFVTLGRARGYLPNAKAVRITNGAALNSPFGGLWTDQSNALDLIQARLDLGWIRRRDASMLRTFALDGIVQLNRSNDPERTKEAALTVHQAFTGMFPDLLFASGPALTAAIAEPSPWRPELTEQNTAALDLHMVSRKVRAFLMDTNITDFLAVLFDAPPKLTASRACLREAAPPERDVAWLAHSLPLQAVAVTFDLDGDPEGADLTGGDLGSGHAWPGSHRLPDLPWGGGHVSLTEARRTGARDLDQALAGREDRVRALVHGREPRRLGTVVGNRMIRHMNLIHWVEPPPLPLQRRTLTAWYCPAYVTLCSTETAPVRVHSHDGRAYCSGVYPNLDPLD